MARNLVCRNAPREPAKALDPQRRDLLSALGTGEDVEPDPGGRRPELRPPPTRVR